MRLQHPARERVILTVLALLWAWNAAAYHFAFFTLINPAAYGFAALFAVQAVALAVAALRISGLRFSVQGGWRSFAGFALIAYAMVVYEVLAAWAGHGFLQGPLFGVAPCPTNIFTMGLFLMARGSALIWLSLIPLLWAVIGTSAAFLLGITEDLMLGLAGITLVVSLIRRSNEVSRA
jgi:hypothetical protein